MGQEGTKGDFEACGVWVCVCVCVCASKHVFDLGLYLCFRCVPSILQGEAFLFCLASVFYAHWALCVNVHCWAVNTFVTQEVSGGWRLMSWKYTCWDRWFCREQQSCFGRRWRFLWSKSEMRELLLSPLLALNYHKNTTFKAGCSHFHITVNSPSSSSW